MNELSARFGAGLYCDNNLLMYMLGSESKLKYLGSLFHRDRSEMLGHILPVYADALIDKLQPANKPEDAQSMAEEIVSFLRFNQKLRALAILWTPSTNMVGQNRPYALHKKFNEAMSGISTAAIRQAKADREEDDKIELSVQLPQP